MKRCIAYYPVHDQTEELAGLFPRSPHRGELVGIPRHTYDCCVWSLL